MLIFRDGFEHVEDIEAYYMARLKKAATWRLKDGTDIKVADMSNEHLSNAIKMVVRNCHKLNYTGEITKNPTFLKLTAEAKKRKFQITLFNTPTKDERGQYEYVDVFIPHPRSKLSSIFFPSEFDSRSNE